MRVLSVNEMAKYSAGRVSAGCIGSITSLCITFGTLCTTPFGWGLAVGVVSMGLSGWGVVGACNAAIVKERR